MTKQCSVEGCERDSKSKGYCNMHYRRVQKHGDPGEASSIRWLGSPECKVEGCSSDTSKGADGYCGMHYMRIKRDGTPGSPGALQGYGLSPRDRILRNVYVDPETGCWEFTGAHRNGYGVFGVGPKLYYTHRWMYEHTYGPIPDGLIIDHLCINPPCCFPDHLEVVTRAENNRRGGRFRGLRKEVAT